MASSPQGSHPNYGSISGSGTGAGTSTAGEGRTLSAQGSAAAATPHHHVQHQQQYPPGSSTNDRGASASSNTSSQTPLTRPRRASAARSTSSQASASSGCSSWSSRTSDSLDSDIEGGDEESALDTCTKGRQLFWSYLALAPILAIVVVAFAVLLQILVADNEHNHRVIHFDAFGIGMVGWGIPFALRRPVYALVSRGLHLDPFLCECVTLVAAGAMDESVRLLLLSTVVLGLYNHDHTNSTTLSSSSSFFLVQDSSTGGGGGGGGGDDFARAYWLGLGWASVETMYYLGQSLVFSRWLTREEAKDPKARQDVRQMLGIDLERTSPWWGVMGRVSSLMVHVGLSCWLGVLGVELLVPAMIVHGSLYLVWGVVMPHRQWSIPATSYGTLMIALSVFLVGLALYGEIV